MTRLDDRRMRRRRRRRRRAGRAGRCRRFRRAVHGEAAGRRPRRAIGVWVDGLWRAGAARPDAHAVGKAHPHVAHRWRRRRRRRNAGVGHHGHIIASVARDLEQQQRVQDRHELALAQRVRARAAARDGDERFDAVGSDLLAARIPGVERLPAAGHGHHDREHARAHARRGCELHATRNPAIAQRRGSADCSSRRSRLREWQRSPDWTRRPRPYSLSSRC